MVKGPLILLLLIITVLLPTVAPSPAPGPTLLEAVMTLAKTVNRSRAQAGDNLQYTIHFNNTGNAQAQKVWINDTLDPHTGYLGDSAATAGGTTLTPQHWLFTNVPAGARRTFVVNVTVLYTAIPGSYLTNQVTLDYLNSAGVKQPGLAAVATTLFGIKVKTLHFHEDPAWGPVYDPMNTFPPTVARNCNIVAPCDYDGNLALGITIQKGANLSNPAQVHEWVQATPMAESYRFQGTSVFHLWVDDAGAGALEQVQIFLWDYDGVNLTWVTPPITSTRVLDNSVGFQVWDIAITIANYTLAPNHYIVVVLTVPAASANNLQFAYDSSLFDSGVWMETSTYVSIPYLVTQDQAGKPQGLFSFGESAVIIAGVGDPFGTADIAKNPPTAYTWINITDPTGSLVVAYQAMTDLGPFSPAVEVYYYTYGVPNPAIQGTYTVRVTAYESNGVFVYNQITFDVRMPIMQLSKGAPAQARAGSTYSYRIYYNNTGTSEARILYVNDTLPAGETYVSNNASVAGVIANGTASWRFTNVTTGSHFFDLMFSVNLAQAPGSILRNSVTFNFTDTKYKWLPGVVRGANTTVMGPRMTLAMVPVQTLVADGQSYVVRAYFNNTGNEASPEVWLNFTYGSNGTYLSDNASAQGYTYTRSTGAGSVAFHLSNLAVGTHALDLTFRLVSGLSGGASELVTGSLAYTNSNGISLVPSTAQDLAYFNEPRMVLRLSASIAKAVPGTSVALTLGYDNLGAGVGTATAATVYLNFSADWSFRNASGGGVYTAATHSISWSLGQVSGGTVGWLFINLTLSTQVADQVVEGLAAKALFNGNLGKPRPSTFANTSVITRAPVMALAVINNDAQPLHGDLLTYTIYYNNTGTGTARNVWINSTLNLGTRYVSTSAPGTVIVDTLANTISVRITNLLPGNQSFLLVVQVQASFNDGLTLSNTFTLEHQDYNYNPRGRLQAASAVVLRSPFMVATIAVDRTSAGPKDLLRYTVTVENRGNAPSRDVWVNLTLSPYLDYLSDAAPVLPSVVGETYSWHLTNFGPSKTVSFVVVVRVNGSTPQGKSVSELASVDYSEAPGLPVAQVKSGAVNVTTVGAPPSQGLLGLDSFTLIILLLAAVGAAAVAAYMLLARRAPIEEVFVVYRDGSLLAHRSKTLTPDKDEDVLAGMFTAVQQFINDSFSYGQARDLKHMNMGEYSIDIEKGQFIYLAVVHRGKANKALTARMVKAIGDLEAEFQPVLKDWGGNMEQVKGIKDRLRTLLRG